jgi:NtrC-family two-component system response regulator AlgB
MLRAAVLADGRAQIETTDLPEHIGNYTLIGLSSAPSSEVIGENQQLKSLEEIEKEYIAHVISKATSLEEAARILKIDSATLWRKRKKYAL